MDKEILLGQGFGDIKFGMLQTEVEAVLGKPDDVEEYNHEDEGTCVTLYYDEMGVDLAFESDDDFKLCHLAVADKIYSIKDKIKVGMPKNDTLNACIELGFSKPEVETTDSEGTVVSLFEFDKESLNLWFEDSVLIEIQFGPYWSDDETIVWP